MENVKMRKTAVVMDKILKVLQGVAAACGIVCLIFTALTLLLGEKMVAAANSISLGPLKLMLKDDFTLLNKSTWKISTVMGLVFGTMTLIVVVYAIRLIRKLLEPMKEGRPFHTGVSAMIKRLAWVTLIGGAVVRVCQTAAEIAEIKACEFTLLFNENVFTAYSFNYMIDLNFIVTACVLFFLSYVFRYGEELQRESDETL